MKAGRRNMREKQKADEIVYENNERLKLDI